MTPYIVFLTTRLSNIYHYFSTQRKNFIYLTREKSKIFFLDVTLKNLIDYEMSSVCYSSSRVF